MCAINDGNEFRHTNAQTYPKDLELKQEHQVTHASLVNLDINLVDWKFVDKLYDKRDSFPFFIVRKSHIDSNIPNNIFYSAFSGETFRIGRSTRHFSDFLPRVSELISKILRQGGKVRKYYSSLKKFINKHEEDFSKFDNDAYYLIRQILSIYVYFFLWHGVGNYNFYSLRTGTPTYNLSHYNHILKKLY